VTPAALYVPADGGRAKSDDAPLGTIHPWVKRHLPGGEHPRVDLDEQGHEGVSFTPAKFRQAKVTVRRHSSGIRWPRSRRSRTRNDRRNTRIDHRACAAQWRLVGQLPRISLRAPALRRSPLRRSCSGECPCEPLELTGRGSKEKLTFVLLRCVLASGAVYMGARAQGQEKTCGAARLS
jgi:hypothetical protein